MHKTTMSHIQVVNYQKELLKSIINKLQIQKIEQNGLRWCLSNN